jgi:hypothetical protein
MVEYWVEVGSVKCTEPDKIHIPVLISAVTSVECCGLQNAKAKLFKYEVSLCYIYHAFLIINQLINFISIQQMHCTFFQ